MNDVTWILRKLGLAECEISPVSWIRASLGYILAGGGHGYCSFPQSSKRCCKRKRCTATRTATPTNISDKKQHTTDRKEPFQAREGQGRTPENNVCRVPPSALLFCSSLLASIPRSKSPSKVYRTLLKSTVVYRFCCQFCCQR